MRFVKDKKNMDELKIYTVNAAALISTYTNLVDSLKIAILVVTFAYTAFKLWYLIIDRKDKNK